MAAPARPYWTGFLKLSLVTIAVRLYTAAAKQSDAPLPIRLDSLVTSRCNVFSLQPP